MQPVKLKLKVKSKPVTKPVPGTGRRAVSHKKKSKSTRQKHILNFPTPQPKNTEFSLPAPFPAAESEESLLDVSAIRQVESQAMQTDPILVHHQHSGRQTGCAEIQTESFRMMTREEHEREAQALHTKFRKKIEELQKQIEEIKQRKKTSAKKDDSIKDFLKDSKNILENIEKKMLSKRRQEQEDRQKTQQQSLRDSMMIASRYEEMTEMEFIIPGDGFPTNLHVLKEYLGCLWKYISNNYFYQFLVSINTMREPEPDVLLKALASGMEAVTQARILTPSVLPDSLFQEFEEEAIEPPQNEQEEAIKELQHIHNRVIFDSFEEALNEERPIGSSIILFGKNIQASRRSNEEQFEQLFEKCRNKILAHGKMLCGLHLSTENIVSRILNKDSMYSEGKGESPKVSAYRKSRLERMVENWAEQTQGQTSWQQRLVEMGLKVEIGESLFEDLLIELNLEQMLNFR